MGKKLTKDELLTRLHSGDLSSLFNKYLKDNTFEGLIYDDMWYVRFRCKICNSLYLRPISKIKRFQQCPTSSCRVRRQKETNLLVHGDENYNNLEKMIDTKLKVYGDSFGNRTKIAESKKQLNLSEISNKIVNTRRSLYGNTLCKDNESKVDTWKHSMESNLSNISSWELDALNKLKLKFKDVRYNYYDKERYPYLCDFYISDIDTFIELNYHWSHGGEPYVGSRQQLNIINHWRLKGWLNNIKVWTIKDVKKREVAKVNNLNYFEFFSQKEFNSWYSSI